MAYRAAKATFLTKLPFLKRLKMKRRITIMTITDKLSNAQQSLGFNAVGIHQPITEYRTGDVHISEMHAQKIFAGLLLLLRVLSSINTKLINKI